jgi:hypothetical protein
MTDYTNVPFTTRDVIERAKNEAAEKALLARAEASFEEWAKGKEDMLIVAHLRAYKIGWVTGYEAARKEADE